MMAVHYFSQSLEDSVTHEMALDAYFSGRGITVTPVDHDGQLSGKDRNFATPDNLTYTVEYKADSRASDTRNAFIETVSVDEQNIPGWAYTSTADVLVYYIPPDNIAYVLRMQSVKAMVPVWTETYPLQSVANVSQRGESYHTIGLLVPIRVVTRLPHHSHFIPPLGVPA